MWAGLVPFLALLIVVQIGHKEVSFSVFLTWEPCAPRGDDQAKEISWKQGSAGVMEWITLT